MRGYGQAGEILESKVNRQPAQAVHVVFSPAVPAPLKGAGCYIAFLGPGKAGYHPGGQPLPVKSN